MKLQGKHSALFYQNNHPRRKKCHRQQTVPVQKLQAVLTPAQNCKLGWPAIWFWYVYQMLELIFTYALCLFLDCNIDKLQRLGSKLEPQKNRNTLIHFLAQNSNLVNTPQIPQEFYHQWWRGSLNQDRNTLEEFFKECNKSFSQPIKAALCNSMLIGTTKFAIQTRDRLDMSKITNLNWFLRPGANVEIEVCAMWLSAFLTEYLNICLVLGHSAYGHFPAKVCCI